MPFARPPTSCDRDRDPDRSQRRLRSDTPPFLLDVHEKQEHAFCALPGSRLLPLSELAERDGAEVVVYCHRGVRSAYAIGYPRQLGFQSILNLSAASLATGTAIDTGGRSRRSL